MMRKLKVVSFILLLLPGLGHADLPSLMAHLATLSHPPRHFTEQRHSELLLTQLTLRGTLFYSDGRLVKAIEKPFTQRFTIESDRLLIEQDEAIPPQQVALTEYPLLFTFVTLFRATLQGDLTALQKHYLIGLEESDNNWRLIMRPRAAAIAVHLRQVTIEGNSAGAQRFYIEEQSGDSSLLELGEVIE
jgi:hypothetical protein